MGRFTSGSRKVCTATPDLGDGRAGIEEDVLAVNGLAGGCVGTMRVIPAMDAGLSNHVWSIQEIVSIVSESVSVAA